MTQRSLKAYEKAKRAANERNKDWIASRLIVEEKVKDQKKECSWDEMRPNASESAVQQKTNDHASSMFKMICEN